MAVGGAQIGDCGDLDGDFRANWRHPCADRGPDDLIPAGVGVIAYLPEIAAQWWSILLVLLVSVSATIAITGVVVTWLSPRGIEASEAPAGQ